MQKKRKNNHICDLKKKKEKETKRSLDND